MCACRVWRVWTRWRCADCNVHSLGSRYLATAWLAKVHLKLAVLSMAGEWHPVRRAVSAASHHAARGAGNPIGDTGVIYLANVLKDACLPALMDLNLSGARHLMVARVGLRLL